MLQGLYIGSLYFILILCASHYAHRLGRNVAGYTFLSIVYPLLTILLLFCLGECKEGK